MSASDRIRDRAANHGLFMSIATAAARLGVCARTVRRWIDRGELEATRIAGRYRVSDDGLRFLELRAAREAKAKRDAAAAPTPAKLALVK